LGKDLVDIGAIVLKAQREAVPVDTGALQAGLTVDAQLAQLRVRVGLIGRTSRKSGKTNVGSLFYGVIVNFGRKAQVAPVQRRRVGARGLRNGRKRAEDIAATYSLRVTPLQPREFIAVGPQVDAAVDQKLADFWARSIDSAGGNA
jgi:hypothetical protein